MINNGGKIFLGLTGEKNTDWQAKLEEINELRISEAAVFLSRFDEKERDNLYRLLLKSTIKKVPLVHMREDISKNEIKFFADNFQTKHFNIHEEHFRFLDNWQGCWDKLYLEMNFDDKIARDVKVKKIGGFCVDLAHFKSAIARGSEEAYHMFLGRNKIKFSCNHLSGYSEKKRQDVHMITSLNQFDYLAGLPKYVFGKIIAMEVENPIKEQIEFKEYIEKFLSQ